VTVRRVTTILAVGLALGYLGILALLRLAEPRLVYAPGLSRRLQPPPRELGLPVERVEFRTSDSVNLVAWVIPAADGADRPWLLICHGNAGNISDADRPQHYAGLRGLGLNLLAFDYRGYGESGGTPTEPGLYRDAEAAYRYLREQRGVPPERIVLFGHSLGSAVAVELATRVPAAGLILDGALASVVGRGQEVYPWIPVRWIAASRYESIDKIGRLTLPKLFLHASHDEVIPIAHGRRLYAAASEPKEFVELQGGHGDAFVADSARYFGNIGRFVTGW
jgi:fermentation-respiration switch protein FrsA (DUF1100 family)